MKEYFLTFKLWKGKPIKNTYGNKAVIDFGGEPVFAELAILRLFQTNGWSGVWVDSYRGKFRVGLPNLAKPITLPKKQAQLLESIRNKAGRSGGCWDVFTWKKDQFLFLELKRRGRDKIQNSQLTWLDACIDLGMTAHNFALIEWDM